jgi:thiol-disulfide isomerase/thioredoxin
MKTSRLTFLVAVLSASGAVPQTSAEHNSTEPPMNSRARPLPIEGDLPSFAGATGWLNSPPLTAADLRGKVVLVDIWTYTCINWLRTLPFLRAWADKYKGQGLVLVGVHSPEFPFEHELANVRRAAAGMKLGFPIPIDNDFSIWRALDNHYWPALYIVDAEGHIRHHQFGEGGYDQSERVIQQLLEESGHGPVPQGLVAVEGKGFELGADWASLNSPESYLGHARTENFASPGGQVPNQAHAYELPKQLNLNHWALTGDWTIGAEGVVLNGGGGRIAYRFHARDVNVVMGPTMRGASVRFRVLVDGKPPGAAHGLDVNEQGAGTASDQRLYQLIRQAGPIRDRQFEIEFLDPGIEAFDFTFG